MIINVKMKRKGEWLEHYALVITGYQLNDKNQFVRTDAGASIINPMDFDEFVTVDQNYEELFTEATDQYPVKFTFGETVYYSDYTLFNLILEVADSLLWEAVDVLANEFDIDVMAEIEETKPFLTIVQ